MKIVFMGTSSFAVPSLIELVKNNYEIPLVISQPDKKKGRGQKLFPTPVKEIAEKLNLQVFQPEKINNNEAIEILNSIKPDLFIVVAYGQILSKKVLSIPKKFSINIHGSILPKYRGAAPIQWSIINGEKETGVTTMIMNEGMDTGDILLCEKIPIEKLDTTETLTNKLMKLGASLIIKTLKNLDKIQSIQQDNKISSYAPILKKENGIIKWEKSAEEITNFVKGIQPWPGAHTFINGLQYKIFEVSNTNLNFNKNIGEIALLEKDKLLIQAKDYAVSIDKIQSPSGKILNIEDFLRGNKV